MQGRSATWQNIIDDGYKLQGCRICWGEQAEKWDRHAIITDYRAGQRQLYVGLTEIFCLVNEEWVKDNMIRGKTFIGIDKLLVFEGLDDPSKNRIAFCFGDASKKVKHQAAIMLHSRTIDETYQSLPTAGS